jgi:hypothetical protein
VNTFLGLDAKVNVRFDPNTRTSFHVCQENGEEYGEVVFGPDIYPGRSVIDPNSALSLEAAAAHELTHYYRWKDKNALPDDAPENLDEALTSLQAVMRYPQLSVPDVRLLVADAIQRLQLYVQQLENKDER